MRGIGYDSDSVRVLAESNRKPVQYRGRIVIGADGVSSTVSRAIGNSLKDGAVAVSVRAYYRDVEFDGAQMKVYFGRDYFPGYGWVFVDDDGFANIGLGCVFDRNFPKIDNLGGRFRRFLASELAPMLAGSTRCGPPSGGSSAFYRPRSIVADRVMLIGDAANQADPLNGGGIHKAMESAWCASEACRLALETGDFSRPAMSRYEALWSRWYESDWRMSEIFMSIAKNPHLNALCLFALKQIGKLTAADPRFREFAGGVFSGAVSQSAWLVPRALYHAFPKDPGIWLELLKSNGGEIDGGSVAGSMRLADRAVASAARTAWELARSPVANLQWGLELAAKAARFAERRVTEAAGGWPG